MFVLQYTISTLELLRNWNSSREKFKIPLLIEINHFGINFKVSKQIFKESNIHYEFNPNCPDTKREICSAKG